MKLYEAGALNKRVMDKATLVEQNTYIPSHKEIDKYENDTVPIPVAKPKNPHVDEPAFNVNEIMGRADKYIGTFNLGMVWVYPYLDDPPIKFGTRTLEHKFEYDLLSPANDSTMLNIENKLYPSISHYLIVRVAQTMPGFENIDKAYGVISDGPNRFFFGSRFRI